MFRRASLGENQDERAAVRAIIAPDCRTPPPTFHFVIQKDRLIGYKSKHRINTLLLKLQSGSAGPIQDTSEELSQDIKQNGGSEVQNVESMQSEFRKHLLILEMGSVAWLHALRKTCSCSDGTDKSTKFSPFSANATAV